MNKRVRERGFRRRVAGSNLVRTRPTIAQAPPPITLPGSIYRSMNPSFPSDYAGISDTSWTIGTTGGPNNCNCAYVHFTFSSLRYSSVSKIMAPVRWSIAAPASNGGQYDAWNTLSAYGQPNLLQFSSGYSMGVVGISEKLLPSTWHAEFVDGVAWPSITTGTSSTLDTLRPRNCIGTNPNDYLESNLEAIAPTVQAYWAGRAPGDFPVSWQIYAIQTRINGSAVGSPIINPVPADLQVSVSPGDIYEIDIWYRIYREGGFFMPDIPGKACMYIPTTLVSNGSHRHLHNPQHFLQFINVDFSRYINYAEQTYNITIAGHAGWTLKDGSNGPHKMETSSQWTATISNGQITFSKVINNSYVERFTLYWNREHAIVDLKAGPLAAGEINGAAYRVTHSGSHYRTTTTSNDYGATTHAGTGLFNQAGTTVFTLVSWSTLAPGYPQYLQIAEAYYGLVAFPLPIWLPTTITLTRVAR